MMSSTESSDEPVVIMSWVSIGWIGRNINPAAYEGLEVAWQELFREPAWKAWMNKYVALIHEKRIDNFLWVEDRKDVRCRFGKSLRYYVPETMFDDNDQIRPVSREIIRAIYARRARWAGVPEPPPV